MKTKTLDDCIVLAKRGAENRADPAGCCRALWVALKALRIEAETPAAPKAKKPVLATTVVPEPAQAPTPEPEPEAAPAPKRRPGRPRKYPLGGQE